jgi:hypothetical protein
MSDFAVLEQQLKQLGRELSGDSQHAEIVRKANNIAPQPKRNILRQNRRPKGWRISAALAASVALCTGAWWWSRPVTLYARMLAALAEAKTVHVTGWTRQIARKWPLEAVPTTHLTDRWPDGKYPIEMWHWTEPDGTTRSYERAGPVILVRHGGDSKEYQEDVDLTWIYEGGYSKNRVEEFGGLGQYFAALQRPSLKNEDLGTREEAGRKLRGIRHSENNRIRELWIDEATGLPAHVTQKSSAEAEPTFELNFTADEPVPNVIVTYAPPATKHVRYGGGSRTNDAWLQHVAEIGDRLQTQPLAGRIALWPREGGRLFANQWSLLTADGKHWIRPLDLDQNFPLSLKDFIRLRIATGEAEQRHGTWRIPKELHELEFPRADLIHGADIPWQEWVLFTIGQLGLEFVDQDETQTVWIAKHDGRPLRPWQHVTPPVPYVVEGGEEKKGYVRPGIGFALRPVTMQELFADFNGMIDSHDFAADKPRIIDETGLPKPPAFDHTKHGTPREHRDKVVSKFYVAMDSPWFVGRESIEMARAWYKKEFGINFTEEKRPVTVHVIRRKK